MKSQSTDDYLQSTHRLGQWGSIISMVVMMGIPVIMCTAYDMWPTLEDFLLFAGGLLALYIPTGVAESITYAPILGSSVYISAITGNVGNIKLPCALNALDVAGEEQNTERGDVICTIAIAVSSVVTSVVVVIGVLLLVPLQPILTSNTMQTATRYMLPALYGCMLVRLFISNPKGGKITGKWKLLLPAILIILAILVFVTKINRGIAVIICIPILILTSWIMYKTGQVKLVPTAAASVKKEEGKE